MTITLRPHEIVEIYKNNTNDVIKYIHANGAETTLKTVPTCVDVDASVCENKNKAVLFISVSTGCQQNCKFCYLTAKKYPYKRLLESTIIRSCIEVIQASKKTLKDKYLKISFMGMGDVFISGNDMNDIVKKVFLYAYGNKYILGIDGVDICTSYPDVDNKNIYEEIKRLEKSIFYLDIPFNPYYNYTSKKTKDNKERTPVRLFISLHSLDNRIRQYLMPNTSSIAKILREINEVDIDIIFHYLLFDGINDSMEEIDLLLEYFKTDQMVDHELRMLRYNSCPNLDLKESEIVEQSIEILKQSELKFKYQLSTGSEISAACGQFLCK